MAALTAWSYGVAAIAYAVYCAYFARASATRHAGHHTDAKSGLWPGRLSSHLMAAALAASALWGLAGASFGFTGRPAYLAIYLFSEPLRYGCWYAFLLLLIWPGDRAVPRPVYLVSAAAVITVGGLLIQGMALAQVSATAELARLVLLHSLSMAVMALVLLEQLFRNASEDTRWGIKPLCLGLGGVFAFDFYMYAEAVLFNRIDGDALGIRGLVNVTAIPLLALSTARSKGWLARVRLSRQAAFQSASLLLAGIYLLLVAGAGYYVRSFGGDWGRALQLALLFAGLLLLLLLTLSGSMRATLRVLLGKHFFRYRYDYREQWLRFTRLLSERGSREEVGQQVIRALADMVESPAGMLWLKDTQRAGYIQAARWNMPVVDMVEIDTSALCEFMAARAWILNLDEYRLYPARYDNVEVPSWISQIPGAWLIVPLMAGNEMTGFVILAESRTRTDVNWEVNDLLRTGGCQAASFLTQIQTTEALLEAGKFDAFNRMSAFVVHDLKNIVTQLALMLRNAERHRDNPEFQQDMLMTVEHSVERMRQLMLQLRQGATPPEAMHGVDLAPIIERIQLAKRSQGREISAQIIERPVARGHEERIERVIGHVVQNALDATVRAGAVAVDLRCEGGEALIEVRDTGEGMTAEFVQERLFKPFQTTKAAGMGVGAYESAQYVRELGGRITVESETSVGTTIVIFLPLVAAAASPALQGVRA